MNRIKSAKKHTIDGILFLQGVYKKDCKKIEDIFTDRLLNDGSPSVKIYDRIPNIFTTLDKHPKTTNLSCWNCTRTFKGRPWFEPQSIDRLNKGSVGQIVKSEELVKTEVKTEYTIVCKGNFCSPSCVRRHINTYTRDMSERFNKIAMLKFVYEIFMGRKTSDINPAPSHTEQVQYGGTMTAAEYQKKIEDLDLVNNSDDSFGAACREFSLGLLKFT
jgi:hypothetical protein